jgi:cell division protein FtsQ
MKAKRKKSGKANISLRRRALIYYQRFILILKLILLALILLFFFTDMFEGTKKYMRSYCYDLSAKYGLALEKIEIAGQKNAPMPDIVNTLMVRMGDPILAVDLQAIKNRLEDNVWVKAAIVERKLPSTIHVSLMEKTPIAIWQFRHKLYLVDSEGNRIINYQHRDF